MAIVGGVGFSVGAVDSQSAVGLGTAKSFAVLAGSTVTNTGPSVISGSLGVSPGTAITGFPPGVVTDGTKHDADHVASQAQADLTTAYNDAAGRKPVTTVSGDLGGRTLVPGVYGAASSLALTGTVTLNAKGDANAVFIFKAGSTLITASHSTVSLINGAQACNVFWQVGSSATLGTNTNFVGSVLALTSATIKTGATVQGRILARNGAVTLDDNIISRPACSTTTTTTTTTSGGGTTTTTGGGSTTTTTTGGGSTTTTTTGGGSTTTTTSSTGPPGTSSTPTTTPSGTNVPGTHTGEPWASSLYWWLAGLVGLTGVALLAFGTWRRRAH